IDKHPHRVLITHDGVNNLFRVSERSPVSVHFDDQDVCLGLVSMLEGEIDVTFHTWVDRFLYFHYHHLGFLSESDDRSEYKQQREQVAHNFLKVHFMTCNLQKINQTPFGGTS